MKTSNTQFNPTKAIITLILIISFSAHLFAKTETEVIAGGERFTIHSKVLDEDRVILIFLPDNYDNSEYNFPVLYVLDGETHFRHVSGATDYLARNGLAPGIIVVAITNVDRNRDSSPVHVDNISTSGGAEKFHKFLKKELLPTIKKNYRTTDYNMIMGHSFGGTFIGYSLLEYPEVFNAYIAVSPYLQFADNYIINEAKNKLKSKYDNPKSFYMTVGDEIDFFNPLDEFSDLIKEKSGKAISFQYVQMPRDNHMSTPYLSIFNGLRFIFSDWTLPDETFQNGLLAIDDHFATVSKKYDYKVVTPENTINNLGYSYLGAGRIPKAIEVFKENVKRFPKSANVYDSLGEAFENNNQLELAKKNYSEAYKLGLAQNLGTTSLFKNNLERVSK
ncbi:MAG TPA: alpha/beta hydrolase-fold protein [Bacteroidales bacterium]|jgi:hypothetical protein|nr:alpha/beta hydrolase-fold protein [Bacteroidales bacterium]|tara:strand:- start:516 stop:1685 length:1170 start_codon:yes stop_codon:yes gene_type:complete